MQEVGGARINIYYYIICFSYGEEFIFLILQLFFRILY